MKRSKFILLFYLIFIFWGLHSAFCQEETQPKDNVDTILTKMQDANSSIKYRGIMTTVVFNNPFSEVCRYKIENYGTILRREELLTNSIEKEVDYDDGKNLWRYFPYKNLLIKELTKINNRLNYKPDKILKLAKTNYAIEMLGRYEANKRTCYKVVFKPKINDRPQQIYWIDSQTGIPFKIEKYGSNNELVSVSSFSEIDFPVAFNKESLDLMVPPQTEIAEVKEEYNLSLATATAEMGKGITLPAYIPIGFILNNIIVRSLGSEKTIQFFYSDGLSSLSIFQKPVPEMSNTIKTPHGSVRVNEKSAFISSSGTMNIICMKADQMTTTVMGEIFKDAILKVAESLTTTPQEILIPLEPIHSVPKK